MQQISTRSNKHENIQNARSCLKGKKNIDNRLFEWVYKIKYSNL